MSTIGDKLTAIYDIKNKIRDAIVNKGGALHEKAALSDYPQAIYDLPVVSSPADTYNYHPNPAWWDIKTILENDEAPEGYVAVAAFLLVDSPYKTSLDVYDAYKTSDGKFYSSSAEHIWDTTKDKDSGEGYKTRYVIAYVKSDSDRWLGKMLCANKWNNGVFYAVPIGCLGMVWNCPVFISLLNTTSYLPTSNPTSWGYPTCLTFYSSKTAMSRVVGYWALCICHYSWKTIQYIDVTSKGKLIIADCRQAFTISSDYMLPTSLKYIAPLYEVAVIYKELLAETIENSNAKYMRIYVRDSLELASNLTDTSTDFKDMNGYLWGEGLRKLEIHVAIKEVFANSEPPTSFPAKVYVGGQYMNSANMSTYHPCGGGYPLNGKSFTMIIEPNTIPLDRLNYYPLEKPSMTESKYVPRLFILYPYDSSKFITENNCTLGIIDWTIINKTDTKPQVHLFPAYQLNGMPASKFNKFIVDYLQDRTGMSLYQMYITSSQNEKLSSTTKQIIAKRNWTLVVFS